MHLFYAKTIADDLVAQLSPYSEVIHIAGSIRRQKEEVKDIEIICIPKYEREVRINLFGEVTNGPIIICPQFDSIIRSFGTIVKGKPSGRYMAMETEKVIDAVNYRINIDFFMPQPHDYYRQLAIRTGSSEYARRHIACAWVRKGWCGTEYGLRRSSECYKMSDTKWTIKREFTDEPTLPPVWESEQHFFSWLNIQHLAPQHRNL